MKLLSFDTLRTLSLPCDYRIKPEQFFAYKDAIQSAAARRGSIG
jgi:hypothetical protein